MSGLFVWLVRGVELFFCGCLFHYVVFFVYSIYLFICFIFPVYEGLGKGDYCCFPFLLCADRNFYFVWWIYGTLDVLRRFSVLLSSSLYSIVLFMEAVSL